MRTLERIVNFGGSRIRINSSDPAFLEAVDARFSAFMCSEGPIEFDISHSCDEEVFKRQVGALSRIDWSDRRAFLASAPSRASEILDGLLRMLLPSLAAPDLIVHGALLEISGEAVLCSGRPGAGKSTIASLFPESALCEELCRIRSTEGWVEVRSLPFWEALRARMPLARIFVLEHGERHRVRALGLSAAMREMRKHIYWPLKDLESVSSIFGTLAGLIEQVPVYRLAFRPEVSVREVLEKPDRGSSEIIL